MRVRDWAALGSCWWLWGCTISAVSEAGDSRPTNSCNVDSDCRSAENCKNGMCQPLDGELEALLIEVTPPSDSPVPHLSFASHLDEVPTSGGPLVIPPVHAAKVTGTLRVGESAECYPTFAMDGPLPLPAAADRSLPITVAFVPRERLLGLMQQLYFTTSSFQNDASYDFEILVPPGTYDVYAIPAPGQQGCVIPPQLFRAQRIEGDTFIDYPVSASSKLVLHVRWPKDSRPLDGWVADVIEPIGGTRISGEVTLGAPTDLGTDAPLEYSVPLVFSTVALQGRVDGVVESTPDLVRLRPPLGVAAPTIYLDRSAIGLLKEDDAKLIGFTKYPDPVTVVGQLSREDDGRPLVGAVNIVSTEISGIDAGIFASFQTSVSVTEEDNGLFFVDLPPGKYRVHAIPAGGTDGSFSSSGADRLSSLEVSWVVRSGVSPQAGKLLELRSGTAVTGQSSVAGAEVRADASPQLVLPFQDALGEAPFKPRARAGLIDTEGRFSVNVDSGRFDISVRPPEELGFGWYVKPAVDITGEALDLGRVPLSGPSVLRGTASALVAGGKNKLATVPIAFASVRAYAYLDRDLAYTRDVEAAVSVVQVAETRAGADGAFQLLVPSSLAAAN